MGQENLNWFFPWLAVENVYKETFLSTFLTVVLNPEESSIAETSVKNLLNSVDFTIIELT